MKSPSPNRISIFLAAGSLVACIVWLTAARFLGPSLIRSAYYGTSSPFFNNMITGQGTHPLAVYLASWNTLTRHVLFILLFLGFAAVVLARPEFQNVFWGPEPDSDQAHEKETFALRTPGLRSASAPERITPADGRTSWKTLCLLGAFLVLALFLRLFHLGSKSLTEDEIFTVTLSAQHLRTVFATAASSEANMILYYLILHFWIQLGDSALVLRTFSLIAAMATLPVIYKLGVRTFGRKVALLSTFLLAISGFHIEYSQDARSYSLFLFLVTLSSLLFLNCLRNGSRRNWTWYIATSALAIYAHLFAILVIAAHWVSLSILPFKKAPWRRLIPSTAAVGFLSLPMGIFVLTSNGRQLSWVPHTTARAVYQLFACLAGWPDQFAPGGHWELALFFVYSALVLVAVVAAGRTVLRRGMTKEVWHLFFLMSWLLVPIALTLAISVRDPAFIDRYLIICLPPFVLLAGYGCSRLRRTWVMAGFLGAIVGLTSVGVLAYYRSAGQDWRGAARFVLANARPGDVVVSYPPYYRLRLGYYIDKESAKSPAANGRHVALQGPLSEPSYGLFLRTLPGRYKRVWLISGRSTRKNNRQASHTIRAFLATTFRGIPSTTQFSGHLQLTLYHR